MIYTITVIVCLASYIFLNWYDKMDLSVGDAVMFTLLALMPFANVLVLILMIIITVSGIEPNNTPSITILKGRE